MSKPSFQRFVTTRVLKAAPQLRYVAFYHADEERLKACMNDYQHRSFVYVLTVDYNGSEHFIYVGQSKAQYARLLIHLRKYAFDHIYLFECEPEQLTDSEAAVIRELTPLLNRQHNPLAKRNGQILGINYQARMDAAVIHKYLALQEAYNAPCLYGFALPGAVFTVLEQQVLEQRYPREIARQIPLQGVPHTNLVLPKEYGDQNNRSQEQIKAYCQKDWIPGAVRIGRDWVLPRDTRFPEDLRKKGAK